MKIGLLQTDGKGKFPNFALCQISAGLKAQGHKVEMAKFQTQYDKIYCSKIFTFTNEINLQPYQASEFIRGGTGYKNYTSHQFTEFAPDYSIYPNIDFAFGFLTRGCIRKCPWCIVPKKEGSLRVVRQVSDFIKEGRHKIVFLDNNFLAADSNFVEQTLEQLGKETINGRRINIDFNQGLDARLITPKIAKLLAKCSFCSSGIRLACDTSSQMPSIAKAVSLVHEHSPNKPFFVYCLCKDLEETKRRVNFLINLTSSHHGRITPFVQPYRDFDSNEEPCRVHKLFASLVNLKLVRVMSLEDFAKRRNVDLSNPDNWKTKKKEATTSLLHF